MYANGKDRPHLAHDVSFVGEHEQRLYLTKTFVSCTPGSLFRLEENTCRPWSARPCFALIIRPDIFHANYFGLCYSVVACSLMPTTRTQSYLLPFLWGLRLSETRNNGRMSMGECTNQYQNRS